MIERPVVTVVTEASTGDTAMLAATGRSLVTQTLRAWKWTIVSTAPAETPLDDARVHVVHTPARAIAMASAWEEAEGNLALVDAGVSLQATSLEKWTWYLHTHPHESWVLGNSDAGDPRAPRLLARGAVASAGGIDAAVATLGQEALETIPYTGWPPVQGAGWVEQPSRLPATTANAWLPEDHPCENRYGEDAKRLLLITPWMAPGGADRVNLDLLPQLRAAGWELTVATTLAGDHSLFPHYEEHTSDLFPLSHFLELVDYPRFLAYLIHSRRPDAVLISNSELGYRLLPYLRARCPEPAYLDFCHSEAVHWIEGGYPRLSVEYQELLDLTVTASSHLRTWMGDRGADEERIHVCYVNVDASRLRPDGDARKLVRDRLALGDDVPAILFVGRVSEDKQPDVLAGTMRELRARGVAFYLLVAGDGPDLPRLVRVLDGLGLSDRVRFLGSVAHAELNGIYAAADVVFLPSRSEGIALVLYEAMAAERPVVAADVGGQAELVSSETGILAARGTPEEEVVRYADALARLLVDTGLREHMGRTARRRIEADFPFERLGERMLELLELARRLRRDEPRPTPGGGLGRACATEAIELTRTNVLADAILNGRVGGLRRSAAIRAYLVAQRLGRPAYLWAVAHNAPGLTTLRDGLRRRLMGF